MIFSSYYFEMSRSRAAGETGELLILFLESRQLKKVFVIRKKEEQECEGRVEIYNVLVGVCLG